MNVADFADYSLDELRSLRIGEKPAMSRSGDQAAQYFEAGIADAEGYIGVLTAAIAEREAGSCGRHRPIYRGLGGSWGAGSTKHRLSRAPHPARHHWTFPAFRGGGEQPASPLCIR